MSTRLQGGFVQRTTRLTPTDDILARQLVPLCDQGGFSALVRHLIRAEARRRGLLVESDLLPELRRGPKRKAT